VFIENFIQTLTKIQEANKEKQMNGKRIPLRAITQPNISYINKRNNFSKFK